MSLSTLFIDLDDTVYPAESGVWKAIRARIDQFVAEKFDLGWEDARLLRQRLFLRYGTTMRGLQAEYAIDEDEYLAYVHDVPLADYIAPDPGLGHILRSFSQRKLIFTNADAAHAGRVLSLLGIADCFDAIVDIKRIGPYCKPMPEAFQIALAAAGSPPTENCALVDDHADNLRAARALGMRAIQVGALPPCPHADAVITRLADLPSVLSLDGRPG
jgi:pyrimidine 5'-nucleotidase